MRLIHDLKCGNFTWTLAGIYDEGFVFELFLKVEVELEVEM